MIKNRFSVVIKKRFLMPKDNETCEDIISSIQEITKLKRIDKTTFTSNLNDNDAFGYTVYFANELRKYSNYFKSIKCIDSIDKEESEFIIK